jgi:hypothetical protein
MSKGPVLTNTYDTIIFMNAVESLNVEEIKAKEFKDFLTKEEVSAILEFAKNTDLWEPIENSIWDGRVVKAMTINKNAPALGFFLNNLKEKILKTAKDAYNIELEIYSDLIALTRWFPGMDQHPHSDNMENTPDHPDHEHREYGIVIYLNNDFEGGATFYPQHNFSITPEPGKLAIHPASTDHMHGVTKVEGAIRYTLTSFLTFDKDKQMEEF